MRAWIDVGESRMASIHQKVLVSRGVGLSQLEHVADDLGAPRRRSGWFLPVGSSLERFQARRSTISEPKFLSGGRI